jgi:hypothetical protein
VGRFFTDSRVFIREIVSFCVVALLSILEIPLCMFCFLKLLSFQNFLTNFTNFFLNA